MCRLAADARRRFVVCDCLLAAGWGHHYRPPLNRTGETMTAIRSDDRLNGKTAIVTGAGSRAEGIGNGRATAVILARHGARVTLVDTTAQWVEETKRLIDAEGGTAQIIEGGVSDPACC